ncbi:MAG: hypothetical protein F6J98_01765 [Moorea sp. SIO4G2]|nr:hypothetical protein [Moorena sp. SIO4G2]
MTHLTKELVLSQLNSTEPFPIDFDDAWQWLEYTQRRNAKAGLQKAGFVEEIDFQVLLSAQQNLKGSKGGRPKEIIKLTVECFKMWSMMAPTAQGKKIRLWYLDIEKEWRQLKQAHFTIAPKTKTPDFQSIGIAIDTVLGNTGVNPRLIAGIKANEIARLYPVLSETMEAAKKLLQVPVEEKPVTVTEIAKLFSEKHGLQTSAREMNLLLTDWEFQIVVMDGKKKTYKPTKKGEPHAQMILQAGRGSNKTVTQLKWYTSLIDALS